MKTYSFLSLLILIFSFGGATTFTKTTFGRVTLGIVTLDKCSIMIPLLDCHTCHTILPDAVPSNVFLLNVVAPFKPNAIILD